ncbi:hypothetical protein KIL84_012458 [Mauremys mutica]|uniref:Uncharacterized protein n=1 Tax=Mauremys mutica TaxID=74926 RepID=A0A9D3XRG7_9SAUR|nr:hypothetical protein KIL84_012458 [Mauremys mutica]
MKWKRHENQLLRMKYEKMLVLQVLQSSLGSDPLSGCSDHSTFESLFIQWAILDSLICVFSRFPGKLGGNPSLYILEKAYFIFSGSQQGPVHKFRSCAESF